MPLADARLRATLRSPQLWAVAATLGAITAMWTTYNEYVPQLLGGIFGAPALVVALVLTADNAFAFFLEPLAGLLSDRTRSRLGQRLPWVLVALPVAVASFALIPLPVQRLAPTLAAPGEALTPFMLAVVGMLLAMALVRTPTVALMPDLVASPARALASGLLQTLSGVGTLGALWVGQWLIGRFGVAAPFWVAGAVTLLAALVLWRLVGGATDEPAAATPYPAGSRRDILRLLGAISAWWLGFLFLSAFLAERAGGSEQQADLLLQGWLLAFTVASVPAGLAGDHVGRQRVALASTLLMMGSVALVAAVPLPFVGAALALLAGGVGWAGATVSSLPLLLDLGPEGRLGTSTGLYYFAFALAGLSGPWLIRLVRPALGPSGLWLAVGWWALALLAVWALPDGAGGARAAR